MLRNRSLIAILCIAALLAAAMVPVPSASIYAILEPLGPLFAFAESVPVACAEPVDLCTFLTVTSLSSRGPPSA